VGVLFFIVIDLVSDTRLRTATVARLSAAIRVPTIGNHLKNIVVVVFYVSVRFFIINRNGAWGSNLMIGSGPCAANKIFTDTDGVNGMCRCRDRNQLLHKSDDKCHRIYSKVIF